MAKAWGAGAWAAEAEQAEAEAKEREAFKVVGGQEAFPSLGDPVTTKSKKKKQQTLSISEFTVGKYVGPGGKTRQISDTRGLTTDEMMMLPTGPRDRTGEEPEAGALGGGFRDYGGYRGGERGGDRDRERGFGGGFAGDRDREAGGFGRDRDRDDGPSRADGDEKWGESKKFVPSQGVGGGGERGGYDDDRRGGRLSDRDLPSRADEVDNWGSTKKFVPSAPGGADGFDRRGGGRYEERRGGGGFDDAPGGGLTSRADEVNNWGAAKKFVPSVAPTSRGSRGGFDPVYREAGPDADRWARREPGRDSEPRPSERPRLRLQPRTVPLDSSPPPHQINGEKEKPHADLGPALSEEQEQVPPPKPKPRSNPFGAARPREDVLAEKGQDWRKIDAELEKEKLGRPGSRPSSSHSSRGGVSSRPHTPEMAVEAVAKPWPKVNPFGDAKPREVLLEERAKDWRQLDIHLDGLSSHDSTRSDSEPEEKMVVNEEIKA